MRLKEESTHVVVVCKHASYMMNNAKNAADITSAILPLPVRMNKTAVSLSFVAQTQHSGGGSPRTAAATCQSQSVPSHTPRAHAIGPALQACSQNLRSTLWLAWESRRPSVLEKHIKVFFVLRRCCRMTVMVNKPMIWLVAMRSGNHHALLGALTVKSGFPCILPSTHSVSF